MALDDGRKPEQALLEGAIRGERVCLEELVNRHKATAYTVAMKVMANREDAEEVVQDSFMKAFGSLKQFKQEARFSTWLYRIVYNTALSKVRNHKIKFHDIDDHTTGGSAPVINDGPLDLLTAEERRMFVQAAIGKLTNEDSLVITLHYIGEKSVGEICEILHLSTSAVKMRLLRGRGHLHTELKRLLNHEMRSLL